MKSDIGNTVQRVKGEYKDMKCPCKGCTPPKRTVSPNCHMNCPEYLKWKKKIDEKKEQTFKDYDAQFTNHPNKVTAMRKKMRWK